MQHVKGGAAAKDLDLPPGDSVGELLHYWAVVTRHHQHGGSDAVDPRVHGVRYPGTAVAIRFGRRPPISDYVGDLLYPIRSATSYITGQLPDNINKEHGLDHGMDRSALHVGRETARHGRRPRQATRRLAVPGHQPLWNNTRDVL